MLDFIARPLGQFLNFIYNTLAFHRYGLAIIIFTIFIKLILLPLAVKQYRSMSKMQELQPKLQEIQKRYKNDKEKLNQETMKLYQESKVNPAGGCAPLLIQMPILISLYWVIQGPLKFMLGKSEDVIVKLFNLVPVAERVANMRDISIINYFSKHSNELANVADMLKKDDLINLNFFGLINLGMVPSFDINKLSGPMSAQYLALLLVPILAAVTTYLSAKTSAAQTPQQQGMGSQMQNSMIKIMPFMTAFFAFSVPAGLGLYWIVSNLFQILQQLYMNKYIIKKKEVVVK